MSQMKEPSFEYIIRPPRKWFDLDFPELWRYRELLSVFVWRNIKVRYKQTVIGASWAVFQPFFTMVVFTVFFGRLAQVPSDGIPYPVFVYAGLLFWQFFSSALTAASGSMVESAGMIQKIYFPRLILPLSAVVTPAIDYAVSLLVLFALMAYYRYVPDIGGVLLLPVLLFISALAASGLGFFLASLNVKYRDVRHALPFFIQAMLFLTPVIYPVSLVPERWQWLMYLNPMAGVITAARASLFANAPVDWSALGYSALGAVALFVLGVMYFKKTERFFADEI